MELQQFITETIVQINAGIEAAQKQLKNNKSEAIVNGHYEIGGQHRRPVECVEFDVAILANEGTETKAGIGLMVASLLKLDAGGKSNESAGRESRIKFKISMSYPMHKYPDANPDDA